MTRLFSFGLLVALVACTGTPIATWDGGLDGPGGCVCGASGMTIHYDYGDLDSCPVSELGLSANFGTALELTNNIRCLDPSQVSRGGSLVLPWLASVQAGDVGTVTVLVTGDGGMHGSGTATVTAAPHECLDVTIHLSCEQSFPDAGGLDAGR